MEKPTYSPGRFQVTFVSDGNLRNFIVPKEAELNFLTHMAAAFPKSLFSGLLRDVGPESYMGTSKKKNSKPERKAEDFDDSAEPVDEEKPKEQKHVQGEKAAKTLKDVAKTMIDTPPIKKRTQPIAVTQPKPEGKEPEVRKVVDVFAAFLELKPITAYNFGNNNELRINCILSRLSKFPSAANAAVITHVEAKKRDNFRYAIAKEFNVPSNYLLEEVKKIDMQLRVASKITANKELLEYAVINYAKGQLHKGESIEKRIFNVPKRNATYIVADARLDLAIVNSQFNVTPLEFPLKWPCDLYPVKGGFLMAKEASDEFIEIGGSLIVLSWPEDVGEPYNTVKNTGMSLSTYAEVLRRQALVQELRVPDTTRDVEEKKEKEKKEKGEDEVGQEKDLDAESSGLSSKTVILDDPETTANEGDDSDSETEENVAKDELENQEAAKSGGEEESTEQK